MKKLIFTVQIVILVCVSLTAQIKISGTLVDSKSGRPVEYGSVALMKANDSTLVTGAVSNPEGKFVIDEVPPGLYYLKISFIGYGTTLTPKFGARPKNPNHDLGIIKLVSNALNMKTVEITGEKNIIESNLDKKVINVEKDFNSAGGTAIDVMQNIPSITVDAAGTISLRGNSNVTILIDGKPSGLSGISSGDLLNQIPASSLESVEVVTNPSARYDPEGTSGIINIILKKKSTIGFNGNIALNAGTQDKYNASLSFNVKSDWFNFFAGYDPRFGNHRENGYSNRTYLDGISSLAASNQLQNENGEMQIHSIITGLDLYLNNFNTLTFSIQKRLFQVNGSEINSTNNFGFQNELLRSYRNINSDKRKVNGTDYNINFKKIFEDKGNEFTADFMFSDNKMDMAANAIQENFFPVTNPYLQNSDINNKNRMFLLQSNYVRTGEDWGRIETGFKSTYKKLNNINEYQNYENTSALWIPDSSLNNNYNLDEQIHAVYGIYSNSIFDIKMQAGLRAEWLISKTNLTSLNSDIDFNYNYSTLYPTLHFSKELDPSQEVVLSYSKRVDRPNPRQMIPYRDVADSMNISVGNPRLQPQFIHSFELGYAKNWVRSNFTGTLFFRQTDGLITRYRNLLPNGATESVFENLDKSQAYGIELIGSKPIFDWWNVNGNFSYFRTKISGAGLGDDNSTDNYSWTARLNSNFNLFEDISLLINANYRGPVVTGQGRQREFYQVDAAVRKNLFGNKLSVILRIQDIFNSATRESDTYGNGFNSYSFSRHDARTVFLGINYNFNNFRKDTKKRDQNGGDEDMGDF